MEGEGVLVHGAAGVKHLGFIAGVEPLCCVLLWSFFRFVLSIFIFFGCNPKPVEVVYSPNKPDTMPTLQVAVIVVLYLFQFPLFFDASLFFAWGT